MLDITKEIFPDFIVRCLISVCRSLPLSFHFVVATRTTDTNLYDRSGHKWKNVIECSRFFCTCCYSPSLILHYIRDGVARTARGSTRNSSRAPVVPQSCATVIQRTRSAEQYCHRIALVQSDQEVLCALHTQLDPFLLREVEEEADNPPSILIPDVDCLGVDPGSIVRHRQVKSWLQFSRRRAYYFFLCSGRLFFIEPSFSPFFFCWNYFSVVAS